MRSDPFAFFVASHYPLAGIKVVNLYGRPLIVQTTLELPPGHSRCGSSTPPRYRCRSPVERGSYTIGRLLRPVEQRRTNRLIVSDFNATWNNRGFRGILGAGVTDGAAARRRAFDITWSQTKPLLPPLVRIDHVLTGQGDASRRSERTTAQEATSVI